MRLYICRKKNNDLFALTITDLNNMMNQGKNYNIVGTCELNDNSLKLQLEKDKEQLDEDL